MQQYRVGQILFLIADTSKVVPIQVVEEVIRTTLEGKEKTYIVKFPDKKETTADIKKVKGTLFNSKEEVGSYMIKNAKSAIAEMVTIAEEMSINIFNSHPGDIAIQEESQVLKELNQTTSEYGVLKKEVQPIPEEGIIKVGNGRFGQINVDNLNNAGAAQ